MDQQHRRLHAHARDNGLEDTLVAVLVMRDVGRGAPHIEGDHLVEPGLFGRAHRAHNATCRARQDGILSLKQAGPLQAAIRLHELQVHPAERRGDAVDIAAQDRREIGIRDRGVAAPDKFDHWACLVAGRNLGEADLACQLRNPHLVIRHPVAMHQDNGDGPDAVIERRLKARTKPVEIERNQYLVLRIDPFGDLLDTLIQHLRQGDLAVEQPRPRLIGDAELVTEPFGNDKERAVALALEQGVGGDGGAHLDGVDPGFGDRLAAVDAKQVTNALQGGILIGFGIFRKQLVRMQLAIRRAADNVGECAAAIDPELPPRQFHACLVHARKFLSLNYDCNKR